MSVYNGLPYLPLALDSILSQSFHDFEFVIVEDGSTDASAELLRAYAARDPRIRLAFNERNLGQALSLNKGLALARGEYIARQDSDDISLPQRLEKQVAYLDSHPAVGLLGTLSQVIDSDGQPVYGTGHHLPLTDNASLQKQLLRNDPLCHGSVMLRRACLERVGGYDPAAIVEDYDLWLRLAEVTEMAKVEPVLYLYRVHQGAKSEQNFPRVNVDTARVLHQALVRRFGPTPPAEHMRAVAHHYLLAAQTTYKAGQRDLAATAMQRALELLPAGISTAQMLDEIEQVYGPDKPFAFGESFTDMVFAGLPPSPTMAKLRGQLLADLHMRETFQGSKTQDWPRVRAHLWPGVRYNPRWLLNRGVLVIAARSLLK
jgi:GT2 family glycosyltransferase